MDYTIDATDKSMGRVASEAAKMLRGKGSASFEPHVLPRVKVTILHASKIAVDPKKLEDKEYLYYSGYPGGQRSLSMKEVIEKKGYAEIFRKAVYGMLPDNRLRSRIMKNLIIEE